MYTLINEIIQDNRTSFFFQVIAVSTFDIDNLKLLSVMLIKYGQVEWRKYHRKFCIVQSEINKLHLVQTRYIISQKLICLSFTSIPLNYIVYGSLWMEFILFYGYCFNKIIANFVLNVWKYILNYGMEKLDSIDAEPSNLQIQNNIRYI